MTFFFQIYLKLCCSKRREQPLKWGIGLWKKLFARFDNRGLLLYPRAKKFDALIIFLQRKSEIIQRPWASLRADLRPFFYFYR